MFCLNAIKYRSNISSISAFLPSAVAMIDSAKSFSLEISAALAAQLWQPVQWTQTVRQLASMGVSHLAECGPGKVLTGLGRRISRELTGAALTDSEGIHNTITDWSGT